MEKERILSDGKPCTIKVLGLYGLDDVIPDDAPGPFYEVVEGVGGSKVSTLYKPPETPPEKPKISRQEAKPGSREFEAWLDYDIYQQYLEHRQQETLFLQKVRERAKDKIMTKCLAEEDRDRVVTPDDWKIVHGTALSAHLTEEDIAVSLRTNFQGQIPWA